MKDLSNIIKEFEKLPYNGYVRKKINHKPIDTYSYLEKNVFKSVQWDLMPSIRTLTL